MLIGNYHSQESNICGHFHSGLTNPYNWLNPMTMRNYWQREYSLSEQEKRDSFPTGTNPPYSVVMADKGSLLSSTTTINNSSELAASLALGINIDSTLSGTSTMTSGLSLITSLSSLLSGSSTIAGSLTSLVKMSATLSGNSSLVGSLGVLAFMEATLSGNTTLAGNLKGTLSLEADITPFTTLSPENLAAAVWNSVASAFNDPGTMGEIMNNMGSVSDPWSVNLPSSYTADQAGAIVARLEDLAKKIKALTAAQM